MSTTNYNASQVGVPYVRVNNISIQYPPSGLPTVTLSQSRALKLADGSNIEIGPADSITFNVDMINNATTPIPLVNPTTGDLLGPSTSLQAVMLGILAVVRQQQIVANP